MKKNDPTVFWNIYSSLCDKAKSSTDNPLSAKDWWDHFSSLMNRNLSHPDANFNDLVNSFNFDTSFEHELDYDITLSEVIDAASHLKRGKAPGSDGIRTEMLKEGIHVLGPILTKIFNCIFKTSKSPLAWCRSTLTVLHKKGDTNMAKNYRGIAVSSNLSKMFCLVLHNRLVSFSNKDNIIPPNQIGFRKGSRTSDHILVLKTLID